MSDFITTSDVLLSEVDDADEARLNLGDLQSGTGFGQNTAMWMSEGYLARPNDPSDGGCAQALFIQEGDTKRAVGFRDPRFAKFAGNLAEGDRAIVTDGAPRIVVKKATGAVALITSDDGTTDGRTIYTRVFKDGWEAVGPHASIKVTSDGIHMKHSGGARISMGSIGGLPAPLDALSSYVKIEAAMISIKTAALSLGSDGGAANDAATTALWGFLSELVAAIATVTMTTPGAAAMAPLAPQLALLKNTLGAIGKVV